MTSDQLPAHPVTLEAVTQLQQAGRLAEAAAAGATLVEQQPNDPATHYLVGIVGYQAGNMSAAALHFQRATELAAERTPGSYYAYLGDALHKLGRIAPAEAAFRRAIEIQPELAVAHSNLGTVLMASGRVEDAIESFRRAVDLASAAAEPHLNLGNALWKIGELTQAEQSFRKALEINPKAVAALSTLGIVLAAQRRFPEAEESCRRAIATAPGYAAGHTYLGRVLLTQKKFDEAQACFETAISIDPNLSAAHMGISGLRRQQHRPDEALSSAKRACELSPHDAEAVFSLGLAYLEVKNPTEACEAFNRSLGLDPSLEHARYFAAALSGQTYQKTPPDVVKYIFDSGADHFDNTLLNELEYRVPWDLADSINKVRDERKAACDWTVFDLGCGTGLCGPLFRDAAARLVGCDLAPNMVQKAEERGTYDELYTEDLTATLARGDGDVDLVLATDVLVYVGDLRETFEGVRNALRPGALFGFSTEHEPGSGYTLQTSGRFSHSEGYVRRLAAEFGFEVRRADKTVIRKMGFDDDREVDGRLYVLESFRP